MAEKLIDRFLKTIGDQGGMASSNNFVVRFEGLPSEIYSPGDEFIEFMCDEAQLPNVNTATGTQNGLYVGLGSVDYPHTRVFTELQLSFMMDANMSILKMLNDWHSFIFGEDLGSNLLENRLNRLRYRNEYACTIKIIKTEPGPNGSTQRQPITYVLEKAYPYAIDAVPLQYGTTQLVKVTAQFKYQRHYSIDTTVPVKDDVSQMNNGYSTQSPDVKTGPPIPESGTGPWDPKVVPGPQAPPPAAPPIVW